MFYLSEKRKIFPTLSAPLKRKYLTPAVNIKNRTTNTPISNVTTAKIQPFQVMIHMIGGCHTQHKAITSQGHYTRYFESSVILDNPVATIVRHASC